LYKAEDGMKKGRREADKKMQEMIITYQKDKRDILKKVARLRKIKSLNK